jgi:hypothetical protein
MRLLSVVAILTVLAGCSEPVDEGARPAPEVVGSPEGPELISAGCTGAVIETTVLVGPEMPPQLAPDTLDPFGLLARPRIMYLECLSGLLGEQVLVLFPATPLARYMDANVSQYAWLEAHFLEEAESRLRMASMGFGSIVESAEITHEQGSTLALEVDNGLGAVRFEWLSGPPGNDLGRTLRIFTEMDDALVWYDLALATAPDLALGGPAWSAYGIPPSRGQSGVFGEVRVSKVIFDSDP